MQYHAYQQPAYTPPPAAAASPHYSPQYQPASSSSPHYAPQPHHPSLSAFQAAFQQERAAAERIFHPSETIGPKSLLFCLVVDNPFDPKNPEHRVVDAQGFHGENDVLLPSGQLRRLPFPCMGDDDLLLAPPPPPPQASLAAQQGVLINSMANTVNQFGAMLTPLVGQPVPGFSTQPFPMGPASNAPNKFQKVIEVILRLRARGLDVLPEGMLAPAQDPNTPNYHCGYQLVQHRLVLSPDEDELFLKIHARSSVLLHFAEAQGIVLNTHPYSFSGGAPMTYASATDKKLAKTVQLCFDAYPQLKDEATMDEQNVRGFCILVPDKMRLAVRLIREAWKYGGCGLQLEELKNKGVFVRHFFPLHNEAYRADYQLDKWASFRQILTTNPLYQQEDHVLRYFGEEVALYFSWLVAYTRFVGLMAIPSLVCGLVNLGRFAESEVFSLRVQPIVNGLFSLSCVMFGVYWTFKWIRYERFFALRHGQTAQTQQELVRDEYVIESEVPVSLQGIFTGNFAVQTLRIKKDGSLVDLYSSRGKRLIHRYFVSFPVIFALTAVMVYLHLQVTSLRYDQADNSVVTFWCSVLSVLISVVFGFFFDKIVPRLNNLENIPTETEQRQQLIMKSFFFSFVSKYFPLFAIALWPNVPATDGKTQDAERLEQLESQMLMICLVKPMIDNLKEVLLPIIKTRMRKVEDERNAKSLGAQRMQQQDPELRNEGARLCAEAQLEVYTSTADDFLEITIQFGFMTMFAATFPWAPVCAFLYNILEIRIDAWKLCFHCQRPFARPAKTIGSWNGIALLLAVLSVITNGYLVAIVSNFSPAVDAGNSERSRYSVFILGQYLFFAFFLSLYLVYRGDGKKTMKVLSRMMLLKSVSTQDRLVAEMQSRMAGLSSTTTLAESQLSRPSPFVSGSSSATPATAAGHSGVEQTLPPRPPAAMDVLDDSDV